MRNALLIILCLCASMSFGQDGQTVDIRKEEPIKATADLHVSDASVTLPLTQNIYAQVTNATFDLLSSEHLKKFTNGGDSVVTELAGLYKIDVHLSIEGNANDIYENVISIGNVIDNNHKVTRKTQNNDVGDMSFSGIYQLEKSQSVKIMLRNTVNNNDPVIVNACLVLFRLGD